MGRSLLLRHILARVELIRKLLALRIAGLLDLVRILRSTCGRDLRLHGLLESRRFGLQNDVYTHELAFSTVDRAPFVDNACNSILNGSVVLRELNVLVLDKLVNDPATVWGRDLVHCFLDVPMVSTKLMQLVLKLLECNVLLLGLGILPGCGIPRLL